MPTAPDAAVRLQAIDPSQSFLIEAPAGSGKTELLIQRYLGLLARASQPESIIALTFTRKAAAEMKERVLAALRDAAGNTPVKSDHQRLTRSLAHAALERSRTMEWDILEDTTRLHISTIDGFCSLLTRQMPLLAKMGSAPRVREFADELYHLAARRTITELAASSGYRDVFHHAALHFDGNFSRLQTLIVSALAKRDQWYRKLSTHSDALRLEINRLLDQELVRRLAQVAAQWPTQIPNLPPLTSKAVPDWLAAADRLLLSNKKEPRKTSPHYSTLQASPQFCRALHGLRKLVTPPISDGDWQLVHNFSVILAIALVQLERVFRERGEVDFTRISQSASEALGTPDEPTELAYRLDFRIEHILIDEFQDTSLAQFELLERLTAQWTPSDAHTLFLVGDPMQSIYQFRDADVSLFMRAAEQGIGDLPLTCLRLSANFRATQEIVHWVETEFTRITVPQDNIEIGAVTLRHTAPARTTRGHAPHIHRFIDDDGSLEADKVVQLVQASLNKKRSTAILVRARTHFESILPKLRDAKVPFEAVDLDALTSEQHILDLLSLTRALHQLTDRAAWLACLRAPFCGLTLADMSLLFEGRRIETALEVLQDEAITKALPPASQTRVARFVSVMSGAVKNFGRTPLRPLVEAAWIALGGPAALDGQSKRDDAQNFFDLLESASSGGRIPDFSLFDERLKYLFAKASHHSPERVQIMTIHKAKGLEFDTVIIPQLGSRSRTSDGDLLTWSTVAGNDSFLVAGIPDADFDEHSDPPYYKLVREQGIEKEKAEVPRLFYVAVTRAREELHLLGNAATKTKGTELATAAGFLSLLWKTEEPYFAALLAEQIANRARQQSLPLTNPNTTFLYRLPVSWQLPLPAPPLFLPRPITAVTPSEHKPTYEWVSETGRHIGSVVHDLLRAIADQGLAAWTPSRVAGLSSFAESELRAAGIPAVELKDAVNRVLDAVRNVLKSERGRWILSPHASNECEWAISGFLENQLITARIDRTFIDESGTRWIIDYKTSSHEGSDRANFLAEERTRYEQQLSLYARLLHAAGEQNVSLGLYFPLLDEWVAWSAPAEPAGTAIH